LNLLESWERWLDCGPKNALLNLSLAHPLVCAMSSWILRGARLSQLQYFLGLNILSFFLSNHPLSLFLLQAGAATAANKAAVATGVKKAPPPKKSFFSFGSST